MIFTAAKCWRGIYQTRWIVSFAFRHYGKPWIPTDSLRSSTRIRGVSSPVESFVGVLESEGILVSMDGKGRALDNVYVERLWRSLKYEDIYLKSYETMKELKEGVKRYFEFYNSERFHQSHNYNTPMYESFPRMGKEENMA